MWNNYDVYFFSVSSSFSEPFFFSFMFLFHLFLRSLWKTAFLSPHGFQSAHRLVAGSRITFLPSKLLCCLHVSHFSRWKLFIDFPWSSSFECLEKWRKDKNFPFHLLSPHRQSYRTKAPDFHESIINFKSSRLHRHQTLDDEKSLNHRHGECKKAEST